MTSDDAGPGRRHEDRAALAVGVRVQLSWVQHAPYTRRADLRVLDRLGVVTARDDQAWVVTDDHGERHRVDDALLEVVTVDPAHGRWRIEGAIPAYQLGERLHLVLRHRNGGAAEPPRATWAVVIAELADQVQVRLDDGREILLFRWGAQADEPDRRAPRWFVDDRG